MNGTGNYIVIIKKDGEPIKLRKVSSLRLNKDDVVSIRTGAGGWGMGRSS